jgi:MFS family permease
MLAVSRAALAGPYARLQMCSFFSNTADGVRAAAVPLLLASTSASPLLVSAGAAATMLPWLLCSLHAGHIIDRYGSSRVFWAAQAARGLVIVPLALTLFAGMSGWLLVGFAFALGVLEVFVDTSATTLLPAVVPREQLVSANARLYGIEVVMNTFVGVSIGAWMFGLGPAVPILAMLGLFLVAALLARSLHGEPHTSSETADEPTAASLLDGLRHVARHKTLLALAIITSIANFSIGGSESLLVLLVARLPGTTELDYGFSFVALSLGALLGFSLIDRLKRRFGDAPVLRGALALIVLALTGVVLARSFWMLAVAMGLLGLALTLWGVIAVAFRQQVVPPAVLGRVNAFYRMVAFGSTPVGCLTAGAMAERVGFGPTYAVLIAIVAIGALLLLPSISQRRLDQLRGESACAS